MDKRSTPVTVDDSFSAIPFVSLFIDAESDADTSRASGPGSNSVSSVSIVIPNRRRTILEVVIRVKRRPACHATGICLGDDAEDQALTRGQAMREARSGNEEEDQDYEGDVDGDADAERNGDDHMVSSRCYT